MIRIVPVGLVMVNMMNVWYGYSDQTGDDNDYGSDIDVMVVNIVVIIMIIMVVLILKIRWLVAMVVGMEW